MDASRFRSWPGLAKLARTRQVVLVSRSGSGSQDCRKRVNPMREEEYGGAHLVGLVARIVVCRRIGEGIVASRRGRKSVFRM